MVPPCRWPTCAFSFKALHGCHTCQVCHGDIKIDNVLLTSWNWVFLADFASFKPTHLPVDNPAAFSYFFDTSGRRTCCIAPERFYNPDTLDGIDSHICRFDGKLLPAMDIFSLGCVIYELITEGKPLFSLASLLAYRQGELDIEPFLTKIVDTDMRVSGVELRWAAQPLFAYHDLHLLCTKVGARVLGFFLFFFSPSGSDSFAPGLRPRRRTWCGTC